MVNEIKDIRIYKILLNDVDSQIETIEKNEDTLFSAEKELQALNRKHAGLFLAAQIICFSILCFIVLRMLYVFMPAKFPYYFLCPIPGTIIELYLRNKFNENEKKYSEKSLKSQIQACKSNIEAARQELSVAIPMAIEEKKKLTNIDDIMSDNIYALNYIARNDAEYSKVSFEVRYEEFVKKINAIDETTYPELVDLKNKVIKQNNITIYRNMFINKFLKEEEGNTEHEKDDNPMSDTENK